MQSGSCEEQHERSVWTHGRNPQSSVTMMFAFIMPIQQENGNAPAWVGVKATAVSPSARSAATPKAGMVS